MATEIKSARDALEKCYEIALQWEADELAGVAGTTDKPEARSASEALLEIERLCKSALAAPPRNCERFATADDAKREFNYLWNFVWQRGGGCLNERNYVEEFERWLFAPATEQEGGDK